MYKESLRDTQLIESLRYDAGKKKLYRLEQHIQRLQHSAHQIFNINVQRTALHQTLQQALSPLQQGVHKIRLTLNQHGEVETSTSPIPPNTTKLQLCISNQTVHSENPFQRHKTNQRGFYDSERQEAQQRGCQEVLFFNQRKELAEGSIHNVFIFEKGIYYTPPLTCGALPGVMRNTLLTEAPGRYQERIITRKALLAAERILLTNSVVEKRQAHLAPPAHSS